MLYFLLTVALYSFAFAFVAQHRLQPDRDLICDFKYEINQPLDIEQLTTGHWFLNGHFNDHIELIPFYRNDTDLKFNIRKNFKGENELDWQLLYDVDSVIVDRKREIKIVNAQNGEFVHVETQLYDAPLHIRVLENYGDVLIVSKCLFETSSLNVYLIGREGVKNEQDLKKAEIRMQDFKMRFEKYYPEEFYIFPLQLPQLN